MKKLLFLLALNIFSIGVFAQNLVWAKSMSGTGIDEGMSIVTDATGNIYTTGIFNGTVDFDPGAGVFNLISAGINDVYISKLDQAGNFVWAKRVGSNDYDNGNAITLDPAGNVLVTGFFNFTVDFDPGAGVFNLTSVGSNDVFILKLDGAGNFLWAKSFGGTSVDEALSIATDASGNVYTSGTFYGTVDFDPSGTVFNLNSGSNSGAFILKLDNSGNFIFAKNFAGFLSEGRGITLDASGNIYATGNYNGTVDFDPGAGVVNLTSVGADDIFISKLNPLGNFVWAKSVGSSTWDYGYSINVDPSGNVYTSGTYGGTTDFDPGAGVVNIFNAGQNDIFVLKLDASGNYVWAVGFGGSGSDFGFTSKLDGSGNIYAAGSFAGTVDFNPGAGVNNFTSNGNDDAFIVKLDVSGNYIWAKSAGSTGSLDRYRGITVDGANNLCTTGGFFGTVDFDPGAPVINLTSAGSSDIFITKMNCVPPTITGVTPGSVCGPGNATLNATASSGTINWYSAPTGGAPIGTGPSFLTPFIGTNTVFYVDATNGCTTPSRTSVTASVNPVPSSSSTQTNNICNGGNSGVIDLTVTGGTTNSAGQLLDQQDVTGGCSTGYGDFWQSFTSGLTGMLSSMDVFLGTNSANTGNWYIYSGSGTGGTLLASGAYNFATAGGNQWRNIVITGSPQVVAGQVYTLRMDNAHWLRECGAGTYGGGSDNSGSDKNFKSYVTLNPYSYLWSNGKVTQDINTLIAGTYSVTATDGKGCTTILNTVITEPGAIVTSATATNVLCNGDNTGAIDLTVSGGTTNSAGQLLDQQDVTGGCSTGYGDFWQSFTSGLTGMLTSMDVFLGTNSANTGNWYIYSGSGTGGTLLASGAYNFATAGGNQWRNIVITGSPQVVAGQVYTLRMDNAHWLRECGAGTYGGGSDNSGSDKNFKSYVTLNPYSYLWSNGKVTQDINTLIAGTYSVTVTDGNSCTAQLNSTVNQPALLIASSAITTSINCNGGTGVVSVSASGGTPSYSGTGTFTVSAGTYTYNVSDANGCVKTTTITVTQPAPLTINVNASFAICSGGTANLTATGASTYTWNPGGLTGANVGVVPVSTTTYTVTGTSALGCVATNTIMITVNPNPIVTVSSSTICIGAAATLTASGATTYSWSTSATTSSITVSPGSTTNYTVTGTNAFGCTNTKTTSVTVNLLPTITTTASPASICIGSNSNLTASGATTYTWNPGGLTGSAVTVSPASTTVYTVSGTNSNGCVNTQTINLTVNSLPAITVSSSSSAICVGTTATLTGSGATTYTWNPGATTGSATVVSPGSTTQYTVTGTNAFGCVSTQTVDLTVNSLPALTLVSSPATMCIGATATLTGTGATSYTWNPGGFLGAVIIDAPSSSTQYTVTGINSNGCLNTQTVNLTVNPLPALTVSASPATICVGSTSTLTVTGATTYTWNPGALTGSVTFVSPGSTTQYTVTGTNSNGCVNTQTVNLTVNPLPSLTAAASPTAICVGSTSTLTGTGATTYTWNPGGLAGSVTAASPGSTTVYTVTGTNSDGCVNTQTVNLVVNSLPTLTATASPTAICVGSTSTLTGMGATTYTWNPGGLTGVNVSVSPASTTIYTVTGTNSNGCVNTQTVNLLVNTLPALTVTVSPTAICIGSTASLTAAGATTYSWNPGALTGSVTVVSPGSTTVYTVTGTNSNGCVNTQTVNLIVNALPVLTAAASPTAICVGATSTLTGTGAITYTWTPGALTGSTAVVSPGTTTIYTVTGTNGNGCVNTQTVNLTVNTLPVLTSTASPATICVGATSTLTGTGATSYTWNPGSLTGAIVSVSPSSTTVYTITGTNVNGCVNTKTLNLTVNPLPTLTTSALPTSICVGGTSTLTGTGATTYTWNPGALTGSVTAVSPGSTTIYTVTGTNVNGCVNTQTVNLTVNTLPTLTLSASSPFICSGESSTLTATGAVTYTLYPGGMTGSSISVSPVTTTQYTIAGTNVNGCVNTRTIDITVHALPVVSALPSSSAICAGESATLTASGASSYLWDTGAGTSVITVSPAASVIYTVTGTDGNACVNSATVSITVNALPVITAMSSSSAICSGATASLTGAGATSYTWNPGSLTGSSVFVSPVSTIDYTLTGIDVNGCMNTQTLNLTVNTLPVVTIVASSTAICAGATATLTSSGANSYLWDNGGSTSVILVSPSSSTIYTVTGTDGNNCVNTETVSLTVNALPVVTAVSSSTAICAGETATLTAGGASSYLWDTGATGSIIAVSPGSSTIYTLTGTDVNSCVNSETVSVTVNSLPVMTALSSSTAICAGETATLTATGATSYTWTPGGLTGSVISVNPSSFTVYTVTGSSGAGCTQTETVSLIVNALPVVTANSTASTVCSGQTVTLNGSGAAGYTWNNGVVDGVGFMPGTSAAYIVTGTDINGCVGFDTTFVTVNSLPVIIAGATSTVVCNGDIVSLTGSGALTYTWNPGALTGATVSVNPSSNTIYTLSGTDGTGCVSTETISLTVNPLPVITATSSPLSICAGQTATMTASGAVSYTWNPGALTGTAIAVSPSSTTVYTVTGVDGSGCANTGSVSLSVSVNPTVTVVSSPSVICEGQTAILTASGATGYSWNTGAGTFSVSVSPTSTSVYTVTGTNGSNCAHTETISLTVSVNPTVTVISSAPAICVGQTSTLTASGAVTYVWDNGAGTSAITVSPASNTIYTVTGTNNNNCVHTETISLTVNVLPVLSVSPSSATICQGQQQLIQAFGANTYTWSGMGSGSNSITVSPTANTIYTVTGTDANGCVNFTTAIVNTVTQPVVSINSSSTNVCMGYTMTASASGASNYTWSNGATTNSIVVQPLGNTTFSVIGTNGGACPDTAFLSLTVLPLPSVSASANNTLVCTGNTVTLNAGGTAVNYLWQPGNLFGATQIVPMIAATTFTVYGQGANGCAFFSTTFVDVSSASAIIPVTTPSTVCAGDSVVLSVIGGTVSSWNSNIVPNTAIVMPVNNTTYTFSASDVNGCTTDISFSVVMNLDCDEVIVYNGFTPNGDGINDVWLIDNIEKFPNNKVLIYNRWGNVVFNTTNYNNTDNNWNGKLNGQAIASGTYFYVIVDESEKLIKKGWIEITN